jgi:eukaryotic translation initiation factor 2C
MVGNDMGCWTSEIVETKETTTVLTENASGNDPSRISCKKPFQSKFKLTFIPGLEFLPRSKSPSSLITSYKRQSKVSCRRDFGSSGVALQVFSNHFALKISPVIVYHYDIEVSCMTTAVSRGSGEKKKLRKLSYKVNRDIIDQLIKDNSHHPHQVFHSVIPVYDGRKNLYCRKLLQGVNDDERKGFTVKTEEDSFLVLIKFVGEIDLSGINVLCEDSSKSPLSRQAQTMSGEAIQVLDIISRNGPNSKRIPIGKSLYVDGFLSPRLNIGSGKEIAFGFYQAVKESMCGPTVVVDRSTTVFYSAGPLIDFVASFLFNGVHDRIKNLFYLSDWERKRLEREIKTLQVQLNHLPYKRKVRISSLTPVPARQVFFRKEGIEGTTVISVLDYFRQEYGIELRFPHMPCVVTETKGNKRFFPMEVCDLVSNQVLKRRLNSHLLGSMVRAVSAQTPCER